MSTYIKTDSLSSKRKVGGLNRTNTMRGFCFAPVSHLSSQVIKYLHSMYMYDDFDLPNLVTEVVSSKGFTIFKIFVINPFNVLSCIHCIMTLLLSSCRSVALRLKKYWDDGPSLVQAVNISAATLLAVGSYDYHIHVHTVHRTITNVTKW